MPLSRIAPALMVLLLLAIGGCATGADSTASDAMEAKQLVERSRLTLESFAADNAMGKPVKDLIKTAKGVYIAPSVLRGAFIVGASGGSGVLVVRDQKGGWNGPAFYTIGGASFGLQAGGDASEVVLLAMTDRGVSAMLAPSVKLGADASVAAGPVGAGAQASTANISADILSFTRAKGLYGGVSVDGAVMGTRNALNDAYYGQKNLTPTDILVRGTVKNPDSAPLINEVARLAAGG